MKTALKYFLIYLGLYFLGAMALMFPAMIVEIIASHGHFDGNLSPWSMSLLILGSQLLPLYVFWKRKYCDFTLVKDARLPRMLAWMVIGWLGCYAIIMVLLQYLPQYDWDIEMLSDIGGMMQNPVGIISVCLMAPVVEECVFRGAIERVLLDKGWKPWWAIVTSALIFAVFHGNLTQGMTALVLGLFMGWVFYRTRNLWLCIFVHLINNTVATVGSLVAGGGQTLDWEGNFSAPVNGLLVVAGLALLATSAWLVHRTMTPDNCPTA